MSYINIDELDVQKDYQELLTILQTPAELPIKISTYQPSNPLLDVQDIQSLIDEIKAYNLPEDENIRYINGYREYLIDNVWCISITSLIGKTAPAKEFLQEWIDKVGVDRATEIKDEAARVGELCHYQILETMKRELLNTGEYSLTQDLAGFLKDDTIMIPERIQEYQYLLSQCALLTKQFLEVYHDRIKLVAIERQVSNKQFKYAGRFDFQFYLYDPLEKRWIPCLGDIKTSRALRPIVKTQLTGYNLSDQLQGWGERLYELRICPYEDDEWGYGWEMVWLQHDPEGLEYCVSKFADLSKEELVTSNLDLLDFDDYEE